MSNKLGGRQGTAYLGTNANQPPNWVFSDRDPSQYDVQNVSLGDMWLNQNSESVWILVSLAGTSGSKGSLATWSKIESGGSVTGPLDTLTGSTGGPITPDINSNINLKSGIYGLTFDGDPLTNTITLNSVTVDNVVETLTGNDGDRVSAIAGNIDIVGDNVGVTVTGQPLNNKLVISLIGGGDAAEDFPTDNGIASSNAGILNINAGNSILLAGSSVSFSATTTTVANDTVQLNVTDANQNTMIGLSTGNSAITGHFNTSIGSGSAGSLTSGQNNFIVGEAAGDALTSGSRNIILGTGAGGTYTTNESDNIAIQSVGVIADANTLRIGQATGAGLNELNKAFIQGIVGITPTTADGIPVFIGSTGQLGTVGNGGSTMIQTVTGDGGISISPIAGNIFIEGDGATAAVTANPGTHTLTISAIGGGGGTLNDLVDDNGVNVVPAAGLIHVVANNVAQGAGSSVIFTGAASTLTLNVTDGSDNTIIGSSSGNATLTGTNNTVLGGRNARLFTTGSSNVIVGQSSGAALTTGSNNVLLGVSSGSAYTSSESSNILINAVGTIATSNTLTIGAGSGAGAGQLSKSFIHGIVGVTPDTADGIPVFIGSAGQLGTAGNGGTALISTVTGDGGIAISPLAGNIFIQGDGATATVTANPGTHKLTISALGGGGGTLNNLVDDNGNVVTPLAGDITVTANNTTNGAGSSVVFDGSVAHILRLKVTDALNNTIIGQGSGNLTLTGTKNTILAASAGSALTSGASNIFLGYQAGSLVTTGTGNFLCGDASLNAALKGATTSTGLYSFGASTGKLFLHNKGGQLNGNTFIGYDTGSNATATNNTGCGVSVLNSLTNGFSNVALGHSAGSSVVSGANNTFVGRSAGSSYISSESSNICIGSSVTGSAFESNVLRIGAGTGTLTGQVNKAFISGIRGITTGSANAIPVVIDSNGQLGTAGGVSFISTLTGNTGGAVSALAGNIFIEGDGTTIMVTDNPGLNKLTISALGGGGASPAFFAYLTNTIPTVTGGGNPPYQIIYDTIVTNTGGAFNLGTSTFTAPVTGLYNFSCEVFCTSSNQAFSTSKPIIVRLITTSRTFVLVQGPQVTNSNIPTPFACTGNNFYTSMTVGDTAIITVSIGITSGSPGLPTLNIEGDSGTFSYIVATSGSFPGIINYFSGKFIQ